MARQLTEDERSALAALAARDDGCRWQHGRDVALARICHFANTFDELSAGLAGPFDWLEADVRMQDGRAACAHDVTDSHSIQLDQWLSVVASAGRGAKLDVKERSAVLPAAQLALDAGIERWRLIINVQVACPVESTTDQDLRLLRQLVGDALVNLSPGQGPYPRPVVSEAIRAAGVVGGPVMFAMHDVHLTPRLVRRLLRHGRVAVWNDPRTLRSSSIDARRRRLRTWGVDGMIDLRGTEGCSYERLMPLYVRWKRLVALLRPGRLDAASTPGGMESGDGGNNDR